MSKLKKGKNWWFNIEFPPFPPLLIRLPSKCELILGTRTMFTKRLQKIIVSSSVSSQVVTLIRHCWVFVGFSRELCSSLQSLTRKSTRTEPFLFYFIYSILNRFDECPTWFWPINYKCLKIRALFHSG